MYKDEKFADWVKAQRGWLRWVSPALELIFTHACDTADDGLKSVAPEGTVLEDYKSRIDWIKSAAEDFHKLMKKNPRFIENELAIIASWHSSAEA